MHGTFSYIKGLNLYERNQGLKEDKGVKMSSNLEELQGLDPTSLKPLAPADLIKELIVFCPNFLANPEEVEKSLQKRIKQLSSSIHSTKPQMKSKIIAVVGPTLLLLDTMNRNIRLQREKAQSDSPLLKTQVAQQDTEQLFFTAFRSALRQNMEAHGRKGLDNPDYFKELFNSIGDMYPPNTPEYFSCTQVAIQYIRERTQSLRASQKKEDAEFLRSLQLTLHELENKMPSVDNPLPLLGISVKEIKEELETKFNNPDALDVSNMLEFLQNNIRRQIDTFYWDASKFTPDHMGILTRNCILKIAEGLKHEAQNSTQAKLLYQRYVNILIENPTQVSSKLSVFELINTEQMGSALTIRRGVLPFDTILEFLSSTHPKMTRIEDFRTKQPAYIEGENIIPYILNELKDATLSPKQLSELIEKCYIYQKSTDDKKTRELPDSVVEEFILNQINKHFDLLAEADKDYNPRRFNNRIIGTRKTAKGEKETLYEAADDFLNFSDSLGKNITPISDDLKFKIKVILASNLDRLSIFAELIALRPAPSNFTAVKNYLEILRQFPHLSLTGQVVPMIKMINNAYQEQFQRRSRRADSFLLAQLENFKNKCSAAPQDSLMLKNLKIEWDRVSKEIFEEINKSQEKAIKPALENTFVAIARLIHPEGPTTKVPPPPPSKPAPPPLGEPSSSTLERPTPPLPPPTIAAASTSASQKPLMFSPGTASTGNSSAGLTTLVLIQRIIKDIQDADKKDVADEAMSIIRTFPELQKEMTFKDRADIKTLLDSEFGKSNAIQEEAVRIAIQNRIKQCQDALGIKPPPPPPPRPPSPKSRNK